MRTNKQQINRFFWAVLWLFGTLTAVNATDVTPQKALKIAQKYVTLAPQVSTRGMASRNGKETVKPFYIFNDAEKKGFVIVSGNDDMGEVLAYGTSGTLDTLNAHPGIKLLLASYQQTYEVLQAAKGAVVVKEQTGRYTQTVSPLLTCHWGQTYPYNSKTGYPFTGCVATAVAQIMYHHQWPLKGKGQNKYNVTYYNKEKSVDFSKSTYDWANMLDEYKNPVNIDAVKRDAVALLMADVGAAFNMQYAPDASGAYTYQAAAGIEKHFDYTTALLSKSTEGPSRFADILRKELLAGFPVYLSGNPASGGAGHAWVTDGFDKNGLFHMNFGWDGQADGYFSLVNLSLSQTGSEFQGRPLAFTRGIEAIVAHPNNGKVPAIDKGLLPTSPQLMFNGSGYLLLKGVTDKEFDATKEQTVEMTSFVNKGKPFRGDLGVVVLNAHGKPVFTVYSDDHNDGGFTHREYSVGNDETMGTDYLMDRVQSFKIKFDTLSAGTYRLMPICVARKADNTWDEWVYMKKAPLMEFDIAAGKGRITEENGTIPVFQLMAEPVLNRKAEQNSSVIATFTVKNLNGVSRDCYVKLQLRDDNDAAVYETRTTKLTEFDSFAEADVMLKLDLPKTLPVARYKVWMQMIANDAKGGVDDASAVRYEVRNIRDRQPVYINVEEETEKPLMSKVQMSWADDSHAQLPTNTLEFAKYNLFKLKVILRTTEGRTYEGPISVFCEDVQTKTRVQIKGFAAQVNIASSMDVSLYSVWLKPTSLPIAKGHTYRVIVMGKTDGKEVELNHLQLRDYFIRVEDAEMTLTQDAPTGIDSPNLISSIPELTLESGNLVVSGEGLQAVSLYSLNGLCVQMQQLNGESSATIAVNMLDKGVYVVRVKSCGAVTAAKIHIR